MSTIKVNIADATIADLQTKLGLNRSVPGKKRYTDYNILCILLVQAMYVFGVQIRNTVLV